MEILKFEYKKCNLLCYIRFNDNENFIRQYQKFSSYLKYDDKIKEMIVDTMNLSIKYISQKIYNLFNISYCKTYAFSFTDFYIWNDKIGFTCQLDYITYSNYKSKSDIRIYIMRRDQFFKELKTNCNLLFNELWLNKLLVEYL